MTIGSSRSVEEAFAEENAAKRAPVADKPAYAGPATPAMIEDENKQRFQEGGSRFSNIFPVAESDKMASPSQQALASLLSDPKERAAFFALRRFPNLLKQEALARYGIQDGRIFYEGEDGKYYFEEPGLSFSPGELAKVPFSAAGPSLPMVGSILGGMGSAPLGGIPGAATGGALGEEIRQLLAMAFSGQRELDPGKMVQEGVSGAAGQGVAAGASKLIQRKTARDIGRIQTPQAQAEIKKLSQAADDMGISLTPAEKTNLKSLKNQQNTLGDLPHSSEKLQDFYEKRNKEQVPQAVGKVLDKISPVQSAEVGASRLQQGAAGAIEAAKGERRKAAAPLYEQAFATAEQSGLQVQTAPIIETINTRLKTAKGQVADSLKKAKGLLMQEVEKETPEGLSLEYVPDARLNALHEAQQELYDMAESRALDGLGPTAKREITGIRQQLLDAMDAASPEYAKARAAFKDASPPVEALTQGEIGLAAGKKPTQLSSVPRTLFETGPEAVSKNRAAYVKAGKEQEWNDGLRAYLAEQFDQASKEFASGNANPGARFRAKVFSTNEARARMRNAMTMDQWQGFNKLMDVLEATGRVPQGGSRTAFAGEGIAGMKREAGGMVSKTLRFLNPSNIFDLERVARAYDDIMMGKHAEKLADIVTSKEGMQQLKALKAMKPNSKKAVQTTSQLLVRFGIAAKEAPENMVPPKNSPYSVPYSPLRGRKE